jgi:hypothetical protein
MSLLNLSSPAGQSPRGKKSLKMWMGAGLVVAVLGIGSTFAATIQINNSGTSEFGQGISQTVYCGTTNPIKITVTPISTFVNSTSNPGSDAVPATWTSFTGTKGSFVKVSYFSSTYRSIVQYQNPATGEVINNQAGYWIKTRNSSSDNDIYKGSSSNTSPNGFPIFVPQPQTRDDYYYGYYRYTNWVDGFFSGGRDAVPPSSTPTKFELGGIKISKIPSECVGRDFVISAYGSTADPLELSDVLNVKEIAVNYASGDTTPAFSFDRTTAGETTGADGKVTVSADNGSIKILFTSAAVRQLADSVTTVLVETQDNIVGN